MEKKIVVLEKPKKNRKITAHKLWNNNISCDQQLLLVKNILNGKVYLCLKIINL